MEVWPRCLFLLFVLRGIASLRTPVEGQWTLLAPVDTAKASVLPSARCNQCAVFVPSASLLFVFGGNEGVWEFRPLNDLWAWDTQSSTWSAITPKESNDGLPTKRFRHSCVYDEATNSILVFGGLTLDNPVQPTVPLNDLWQYDIATNTWTELHPEGQLPSPRNYHVAALQRQEAKGNLMVVFGGIDDSKRYNDLWKYDIDLNWWTSIEPEGPGFAPPPLSNPAYQATKDGEFLYIFGGQRWWGYQGIINSVYKLHLPSNTWEEVAVTGQPPEPKIGASAVILGDSSLLVFGGYNADGYYVNDIHILDLATNAWRKGRTQSTPTPGKRYAHSAVLQDEEGMLVFGGYSDYLSSTHNFNDLWLLAIEQAP